MVTVVATIPMVLLAVFIVFYNFILLAISLSLERTNQRVHRCIHKNSRFLASTSEDQYKDNEIAQVVPIWL